MLGPCKKDDLVWAVKTRDVIKMFESEFLDMKQVAAIAGGAVTLRVNVTGHAGDEEQSVSPVSSEKGEGGRGWRLFLPCYHNGHWTP